MGSLGSGAERNAPDNGAKANYARSLDASNASKLLIRYAERMDLELRHHRHALALAEHRNFLRAARALEISQPALSRSIQELERRMGATLFSRARGGVAIAPVAR